VLLVLWYLDEIGWRSDSGFYKIGQAPAAAWVALAAGQQGSQPLPANPNFSINTFSAAKLSRANLV